VHSLCNFFAVQLKLWGGEKNNLAYFYFYWGAIPRNRRHCRNRFLKKLMISAGVWWNGKTQFFSSTLKRLKSTRRLTLTFWRCPCCQNAAFCTQTMISSSCKTHHTTPKQLKILFETTRPISLAHKNGHAFARFESARLLSLGYLARSCLRRKAWTICESQRSSECYQKQMARCRWPDSQKSHNAVEKAFSSCDRAEWGTYSAHFLLISWLIRITVLFWCSLRTTNNINDELLANIVLWCAILFRLYHG